MSDELDITIVTGLSGAGRSEAANVLEDLGFFVIDNLPPLLIPKVAELARAPGAAADPLRPRRRRPLRRPWRTSTSPWSSCGKPGPAPGSCSWRRPTTCSSAATRPAAASTRWGRGSGCRRPSPRSGRCSSRSRPRPTSSSTRPTSTSTSCGTGSGPSSPAGPPTRALQTSIVSFGFKHGLPLDVDLVFDCRFLPNPHWVESLRPLRGTDAKVKRLRDEAAGDRERSWPSWSGSSPCSCRPT